MPSVTCDLSAGVVKTYSHRSPRANRRSSRRIGSSRSHVISSVKINRAKINKADGIFANCTREYGCFSTFLRPRFTWIYGWMNELHRDCFIFVPRDGKFARGNRLHSGPLKSHRAAIESREIRRKGLSGRQTSFVHSLSRYP